MQLNKVRIGNCIYTYTVSYRGNIYKEVTEQPFKHLFYHYKFLHS